MTLHERTDSPGQTPRGHPRTADTVAQLRCPVSFRALPTRKASLKLEKSPRPPCPPHPWRAHSHLRQRKLAGPTGTFLCGGARGWRRAGGRDEGRGVAGRQAAGSSYTKAPVSALLPPGTDINNTYIYLYICVSVCIYIHTYPSGLGATHFPKRPGHGRVCSCSGWGLRHRTRG